MNYNGIWKNTKSNELFKLSCIDNTDEYLIEWKEIENDFLEQEEIQIYIGDQTHSRIPNSRLFGTCIILNIVSGIIEINGIQYEKVK